MSLIYGSPVSQRKARRTSTSSQADIFSSPQLRQLKNGKRNSLSIHDIQSPLSSPFSSPKSTPPGSPQTSRRKNQTSSGDRFIASRSSITVELAHFSLTEVKENEVTPSCLTKPTPSGPNEGSTDTPAPNSPALEEYKTSLEESLFNSTLSPRVLNFKNEEKSARRRSSLSTENPISALYSPQSKRVIKRKTFRTLPEKPEKVLDAPEMVDDFYLNLLDWSSTNIVAVALSQNVYLWNAATGTIQHLTQTTEQDDMITSVSFNEDGSYVAVGTALAEVQIWDVERSKQLRTLSGHMGRVGALAWSNPWLTSGSRDSLIINHDVRVSSHKVNTLRHHTQEVCGLKWSLDGSQLASGGNDNLLNVWDRSSSANCQPLFSFTAHTAAVKGLAWCPWQSNLLASGGGTADRKLRFWNTSNGTCLNTVDTKSQVCSIQWSKNSKELVTSHGFSQNQLIVWKYPTMTKIGELTGHESRVLHLAQSPDGTQIVSAAADETLRFWKVFEPVANTSHAIKKRVSTSGRGGTQIRDIR